MPSFDIVSEIDLQEVRNGVENALREVTNRFDFRGVLAEIELNEKNKSIKITSESDFQVWQLVDVLKDKLLKRGIENGALELPEETIHSGKTYSVEASLKQGIETVMAKQIVKTIKESKIKVQTQIQGEQVRVTGKARDDLQAAITLIKKAELGQPFQYINFRD